MKKTKQAYEPQTTRPAPGEKPGIVPEASVRSDEKQPEDEAVLEAILDDATRWVRANQTVALLGAFGIGVFLGVLLRK
ncbi:MAG: hypothetical protein SH809_20910 [Rhodothermales bacterium]|nr:hypothetical protein [Rhodothermales bacterium]